MAKVGLGLYDEQAKKPTSRGYMVVMAALFVFSLSAVSLFYQMFKIPEGQEAALMSVPSWVLCAGGLAGLAVGAWVLLPSATLIRNAEARRISRAWGGSRRAGSTGRELGELLYPLADEFSQLLTSPAVEIDQSSCLMFVEWCFKSS